MFRKMQNLVLSNFVLLLVFIANTGVSNTSIFITYEPNIPKCLKK